MEITRSGILRDCLEEKNREMHRYSKHGAGLLPLEGYEQHFEDLQVTCNLLRDMILKAEVREDVVRTLGTAQWQKDLMDNGVTNEWPSPEKDSWLVEHNGKNYMWNPDRKVYELLHSDDEPVDEMDLVKMTPDEVALRRRYRKAEGFKPAPVVYPGGES